MTRYLDVALMLIMGLFFLMLAYGQGAGIVALLGVAVASFVAGAILVVALLEEDHNG